MKRIKILGKEHYIMTKEELITMQKALQNASVRVCQAKYQLEKSTMAYIQETIKDCKWADESLEEAWKIAISCTEES